jgi:hypothetical protein
MAELVTIGGSGALFVGEDKELRLEVLDADSIPVNISTWSIHFFVRVKDTSGDPAIFDKTATVIGVYSAVRATNTQRASVTLSDTELNTVKAKTYRHSWKRMDDGSETVLAYGPFVPEKATAT